MVLDGVMSWFSPHEPCYKDENLCYSSNVAPGFAQRQFACTCMSELHFRTKTGSAASDHISRANLYN